MFDDRMKASVEYDAVISITTKKGQTKVFPIATFYFFTEMPQISLLYERKLFLTHIKSETYRPQKY